MVSFGDMPDRHIGLCVRHLNGGTTLSRIDDRVSCGARHRLRRDPSAAPPCVGKSSYELRGTRSAAPTEPSQFALEVVGPTEMYGEG